MDLRLFTQQLVYLQPTITLDQLAKLARNVRTVNGNGTHEKDSESLSLDTVYLVEKLAKGDKPVHALGALSLAAAASKLVRVNDPAHEILCELVRAAGKKISENNIYRGLRACSDFLWRLPETELHATGEIITSDHDKPLIEAAYRGVFEEKNPSARALRDLEKELPLFEAARAMSVLSLIESPLVDQAVSLFKAVGAAATEGAPTEKAAAEMLRQISPLPYADGSEEQMTAHRLWMECAQDLAKRKSLSRAMDEAATYAEVLGSSRQDKAEEPAVSPRKEQMGIEVSVFWGECGKALLKEGRGREALTAADTILQRGDLTHPIARRALSLATDAGWALISKAETADLVPQMHRVVSLADRIGDARNCTQAQAILTQLYRLTR